MKKKLIAIVASLAMVATMVPATAFAGVSGTNATITVTPGGQKVTVSDLSGITLGKATITQLGNEGTTITTGNLYSNASSGWTFNESVTGAFENGKLALKGAVPYTTDAFKPGDTNGGKNPGDGGYDREKEGWYDPAERAGHFVGLRVRTTKPDNEGVVGWAVSYPSEEKETLDNGTVKTGSIDKLYIFKGFGKDDLSIVKKLPENGNVTFTVYYLTQQGVETFAKYSHQLSSKANYAAITDTTNEGTIYEALFGNADLTGTSKNATVEQPLGYTGEAVDARLTDVIAEASRANGIAATKAMTVDTSSLALLTKAQSDNLDGFKKAVNGDSNSIKAEAGGDSVIDSSDNVTNTYRQRTIAAQAIYDALDTDSKAVVANAAKETTLYAAYEDLKTAQDNIKSFDQISAVAELVKVLPAPSALDLKDEAAVEQVQTAEAAVKKLSEGAQTALLTATNGYLTATQISNYTADVAKIKDATINAVIDAINALPTLPKEFTDKASVDAVYTPLAAVTKAYENLNTDDQTTVDNRTIDALKNYQKDYEKLMKEYVDPLYEKAAEIDVEKALTAEEIATIKELRDYVEGAYIKTRDIDGFRQTVYDKLIAALGNEYDLSEAAITLADADNIVYDGTKKTPAVTVTDQAGKEIAADNYTVIYSDNKDAGEATVTVAAKGSTYTGSTSTTFTIKPAALTDAMVKSVANTTYTGKAVTPAVTVDKGVTYEVTYSNNTAVGKATAVITGTGNYSGEITKNFIVKPAKEAISSLKAGKKSLTVAYKAQTGAKYRIVYSPAKGQAKAVNTTATKKTIKNLKAGKTYKVKVRAYKTVDGTAYNGTYSTVKKVKVK